MLYTGFIKKIKTKQSPLERKEEIHEKRTRNAGIGMMGYGAYRGEAAVVLSKAIKLCLECVGIG